MYLIIDEGNTRIKLAVFDEKQLIDVVFTDADRFIKDCNQWIFEYGIRAAILSSVTDRTVAMFETLTIYKKYTLSINTPLPFKNVYKTPATLGVDRLALATAAYSLDTNRNVLVIDAGTCITYDFISTEGYYIGGAISPGVQMRFDAMSHFTEKLPQITFSEPSVSLVGDSTYNSMLSGVINGMVFEIEGVIQAYQEKFKEVYVIFTGGDANFLCKPLKNSIFVNPNFLLEGLKEVLIYQLRNETKFKK